MSSHPCGRNAACAEGSGTSQMVMATREGCGDDNTVPKGPLGASSNTNGPAELMETSATGNSALQQSQHSSEQPHGQMSVSVDRGETFNIGHEINHHIRVKEMVNQHTVSCATFSVTNVTNNITHMHGEEYYPRPEAISAIQGNTEPETSTPFDEGEADYDVSSVEFIKTIKTLTQYGFVFVSTLPGPQCTSFVSTLKREFHQKGYKVQVWKWVSDWGELGRVDRKSLVFIDTAFGLGRLDKEHYSNFIQHGMCSINSHSSKIVFLLFPHVLRELQHCDSGSHISCLVRQCVVTLGDDPLLSVHHYLFLFLRMLRDPSHGLMVRKVLCRTMQGQSNVRHGDQADAHLHCQGLEQYSKYQVQEFASLLKGFLLDKHGLQFISRHMYDAAGVALGHVFSNKLTLHSCDVKFLVQRVCTESTAKDFCLVLEEPDKSRLLMQRVQEAILTGQVPEICQHPCLNDPNFLREFEAFCREEKQLFAVISAVDSQHSLPLLYWSLWAQSLCLTKWCLQLMKDLTDGGLLSHYLLCSAFLAALLKNCGHRDPPEVVSYLRDQLLPFSATTDTTLTLPVPCMDSRHTDCVQNVCDKVTQHLKRGGLFYLGDPSAPIPLQLLTMTLVDDTIQLEFPCQQPYLALRAVGDREVDEVDREGNTLLHWAARTTQVQEVRMAVCCGASVMMKNNEGQTAPQLAAGQRDQHRDRRSPCPESWIRLQKACAEGDMATVKELLCVDLTVYDKGPDGMTPLLVACYKGQTDIVQLLLNSGADINVNDNTGKFPLLVASQHGHTDIAQLLVLHGADIQMKSESGESAVLWLLQHKEKQTVKTLFYLLLDMMVRKDNSMTPLHTACYSGQTETARLLLQHDNIDINITTEKGWSPLYIACCSGHTEVVQLLLQHNAEVNLASRAGETPLFVACLFDHYDIVSLLIEHNAEVKMMDCTGETPLHVACLFGHYDIVDFLLRYNPDLTMKIVSKAERDGATPLHCACLCGHSDIVDLLLLYNADLTMKTVKEGLTPLQCACMSGHSDLVALLLRHNADLTMKTKDGHTALDVAQAKGHKHIADMLQQHISHTRPMTNDTQLALSVSVK